MFIMNARGSAFNIFQLGLLHIPRDIQMSPPYFHLHAYEDSFTISAPGDRVQNVESAIA